MNSSFKAWIATKGATASDGASELYWPVAV